MKYLFQVGNTSGHGNVEFDGATPEGLAAAEAKFNELRQSHTVVVTKNLGDDNESYTKLKRSEGFADLKEKTAFLTPNVGG